jgi:hypothetical protein
LETELNLDPNPELITVRIRILSIKLFSGPAASGSTTLIIIFKKIMESIDIIDVSDDKLFGKILEVGSGAIINTRYCKMG